MCDVDYSYVIPPLHLLIERRSILHCIEKGIRPIPFCYLEPVSLENRSIKEIETLLDEEVGKQWQKLWDNEYCSDKWIKRLVPKVTNKYMELLEVPNFFLSQAVMGHGAFGSYLHRIGKRTMPQCPCGNDNQTLEHVLMECHRYETGRPCNWTYGMEMQEIRKYLITTIKQLWDEEKEEEKSGINRVRCRSHCPGGQQRPQRGRTGTSTMGAGPMPSSR